VQQASKFIDLDTMPHNQTLADRIREAFAHLPDVEEKKMFGSIAFMVNSKMCIAAGKNRIMCRISPDIYEDAITRNGVHPVVMKGKELKGYVHVDEDVLQSKKELDYWIEHALEFNKVAKSSKKK
jgi:TfoX/Sxy family transcriptional regulator of competence genes